MNHRLELEDLTNLLPGIENRANFVRIGDVIFSAPAQIAHDQILETMQIEGITGSVTDAGALIKKEDNIFIAGRDHASHNRRLPIARITTGRILSKLAGDEIGIYSSILNFNTRRTVRRMCRHRN